MNPKNLKHQYKHTGLGLRKDFIDDFISEKSPLNPTFLELAPENWMGLGGYWKKTLHQIRQDNTFVAHGLSLSIGTIDPLDFGFLKSVKDFLDEFDIKIYSEHLSYSQCHNIHVHELLPLPFTKESADHIADRISQVQDYLKRTFVLENISYYTAVSPEMEEWEFINHITQKSGCKLLMDINNVYVNSFNHKYDPYEFLDKINLDKIEYIHIAGHTQKSPTLIIDTHAEPVIDPVYQLFDTLCQRIPKKPILLERDFNIPELEELAEEMDRIDGIAIKNWN